jgi:hypothetical protein
MPAEQRRGLKIGLGLKDNLKAVSKPSWMKFYKKWTASNMNIEQYLVKVAEDNPTLMAQVSFPLYSLAHFVWLNPFVC